MDLTPNGYFVSDQTNNVTMGKSTHFNGQPKWQDVSMYETVTDY